MKFYKSLLLCFTAAFGINLSNTAHASTKSEQSLVDHATLAVQDIYSNVSTDNNLYSRLKEARAVMICPAVTRISLVFGGSGGSCVLLSRDAQGSWSSPAFYKMSSGSFGIQLGVENAEIMLFVMNETSLRSLLDSQFTMGASASATAATANSSADSGAANIYTIQKSSGLFAGAALKGSKLKINSKSNHNYYNETVGPEDIVIAMRVNNSGADPLRRILMKLSNEATSSTSKTKTKTNKKQQDNDSGDVDSGAIQLAPSGNNGSIKSENLAPPPVKKY
ncbi:Lipid-binding SYLF domain [Commensalibacter communis]|uniref:lipid-binding SYLF domain-containing protein n=1 Tax=Commensalibacter communis TaxID=2972786 RepID=UPI0022FF9E10|nr:lipid-binding SYLF domain-containing protein [Commensalibacter communis]CAI3943808.1 Lipid-binding SYLF domain [Commensalibacter communis]CAI3945105.1 Lipid-binding SYLF domain [Commensalibacter communis]